MVGDGKNRSELQSLAAALGCQDRVEFLGQLTKNEVRAELDKADLFVLPSYSEGLPRAMIEAMARGLPCIGTEVGGIPELLSADSLVPVGNPEALAQKIHTVAQDPARMTDMSAANWRTARSYRSEVLERRREAFYTHLRRETKTWLGRYGTGRDQ
jgi:glycosyltransferase involved in cell wall biosynthesis